MFSLKIRESALAVLLAGFALAGIATAAEPAAPPPPKPYVIQGNVPKYVREAVESKDRTPAMTARDADRKPAELLALSGVKPGDRVAIKATEAPQFRRIAIQRTNSDDPDRDFPPGPLRLRLRADTTPVDEVALARSRARRPPLDVNAGRGFAFVDHRGGVYPSGFMPLPAGSVRSASFPDIYRDAELLRSLRDPDRLGGRCGRCEFRSVCGGSRSRAYAVTGDPLAEDPGCNYQPQGSAVSQGS